MSRWRRGRPRPLTPEIIETLHAKDIVTTTYLDGFLELVERLDGDAEAFMKVVDSGADVAKWITSSAAPTAQ